MCVCVCVRWVAGLLAVYVRRLRLGYKTWNFSKDL